MNEINALEKMDSETIEFVDSVLEKTREFGALVGEKASDEDIENVRGELKKNGLPDLPPDLIEFWKTIACGYAWNGFEFPGAKDISEKGRDYVLRELVSFNLSERGGNNPERLLLGAFDDDVFVYNARDNVYERLDNFIFDSLDEYETFGEMFACNVSDQIFDDDFDDDFNDDETEYDLFTEEDCADE